MTFLTILGVTEILCSFRLLLEGKAGKDIPESLRLEFSEKFLANSFDLSDAEDNTSMWLNWGGIADLPLLRTLLAIRQKSWEPSFWEMMNSFVWLAYASLGASRTKIKSMENKTKTWSELTTGGKAIVKQIVVSEGINKSKTSGLWESLPGIWVGKLTKWVRSFEIAHQVSHSAHTLVEGLVERNSSILYEIEPKTMHKGEEDDW